VWRAVLQVINRIMSDCIVSDIPHPALKEVLGHTPLQVLAGAVLGVAVGIGYSSCLKGLVVM
jgi:acid phosphatase family membrane protein YuiD